MDAGAQTYVQPHLWMEFLSLPDMTPDMRL